MQSRGLPQSGGLVDGTELALNGNTERENVVRGQMRPKPVEGLLNRPLKAGLKETKPRERGSHGGRDSPEVTSPGQYERHHRPDSVTTKSQTLCLVPFQLVAQFQRLNAARDYVYSAGKSYRVIEKSAGPILLRWSRARAS